MVLTFGPMGPYEKLMETLAPPQQKLQRKSTSPFASVLGCLLSLVTCLGPPVGNTRLGLGGMTRLRSSEILWLKLGSERVQPWKQEEV